MVLLFNGIAQDEPPPDSRTLFHNHSFYRDAAASFLSIPSKVIGAMGLLYIQQREMAVTVPHDKNVAILGTDDATTCIALVLRHSGSGAVGLAHLDGAGTEDAIVALIQRVQELSVGYAEGRLELQLMGGVSDNHNYSEELFYNILHTFHKQPVEVDLTVACVCELNTIVRNGVRWPIIYGVGINIKSGEVFPATFPEKGPDTPLRLARQLTGFQQVLDV